MNTLKTIFFVLYLLFLPVVLYFLYNSFENETIKLYFTFIFIGITGAFVAVSFKSHLERNSKKAAEQRLLFLARMPENATFKETESTLYFEDGSKQVTSRRTASKRLNTPDKRRHVVCYGDIKEYDKEGNLINTRIFMT